MNRNRSPQKEIAAAIGVSASAAHRHPDGNDDEGAYATLDICFAPRLRITGKITRFATG